MRAETMAQMRLETTGDQVPKSVVQDEAPEIFFEQVRVREAFVDAMWFVRASHEGREAWELRLVAATPYALFELFEPDEAEEDREDVRREMEARLSEYALPPAAHEKETG